MIYAMCQQTRVDNLIICYRKTKNKLMSIFNASVLLLTKNFVKNTVKVVCGSTQVSPRGSKATFDNVMTKFMITTGQTHEKMMSIFFNVLSRTVWVGNSLFITVEGEMFSLVKISGKLYKPCMCLI